MASTIVTITRANTSQLFQPLLVNLTVSGTAQFGTDFTVSGATSFNATSASVTIPANQTSKTITLSSVVDTIFEQDETVILTVVPTAGVSSGDGSVTWSILNDDIGLTIRSSLQFEGSNNSTSIVDSTGLNIWTNNSAGVISTAQSFNGSSSLLLNTVNGSIQSPYSSNLSFANDFEWSGAIYPTTVTGNLMAICGNAVGGGTGNSGIFLSITNGSLLLRTWVGGMTPASIAGVVTNQWQTFRATRVGNTFDVYLNGVKGTSSSANVGTTPNHQFTVGSVPNNSGFASNCQGYLDNLVLSS